MVELDISFDMCPAIFKHIGIKNRYMSVFQTHGMPSVFFLVDEVASATTFILQAQM